MLSPTVFPATGHVWLRAAVCWLSLTGPVLLFPTLVDPAWRAFSLSIAGVGALSLCAIGLARDHAARIWGWCLVLAVAVSWLRQNTHDLEGTSHFGGVAFGLLLMTVVAHLTSSARPRLIGLALLVLGSSAGMVLGVLSLSADNLVPAKIGWLGPWAVAVLDQLPNVTLALPGMDHAAPVNANALGGTAGLVLPLAAGLVFSARRATGAAPAWFLASIGISAIVAGLLTISLSLSRTAMGAVLCTGVVAGLRFRPTRRWTAGVVIAAAVLAAVTLSTTHHNRASAVGRATDTFDARLSIWRVGMQQLWASPWTGIGLGQFRDVAPYQIHGRTDVAHAHNIVLQTALDIGIPGLLAYLGLFGSLLWRGLSTAALQSATPAVAAAASLSLLVIHLFGLLDAIALGSKVGTIQWVCAGLILGASRVRHREIQVGSGPAESLAKAL